MLVNFPGSNLASKIVKIRRRFKHAIANERDKGKPAATGLGNGCFLDGITGEVEVFLIECEVEVRIDL